MHPTDESPIRPSGPPALYMTWSHLAFLHWPVPAASLRGVVPERLEIEEFDGTAWLGLVPFTMPDFRLARLPNIPTMRSFHECNVRTYVRSAEGDRGVWFMTLDAMSWIAVLGARWVWSLNYRYSRIAISRDGPTTRYEVRRSRRSKPTIRCSIEAGDALATTAPGSLDHFLTERYSLFSCDRRGRIHRGRIWHPDWRLTRGRILEIDGDLVSSSSGVEPSLLDREPHCLCTKDIEVVAWPLELVRD